MCFLEAHKKSDMLKFQASMLNDVVRGEWDIDPYIYTTEKKEPMDMAMTDTFRF